MKITLLLAEDHKIMRDGLRQLLDQQKDISVVGVADNGRMAVELARQYTPNVIIMDIVMPELNGAEATKQIVAKRLHTKVLALSMHSDSQHIFNMVKAGVSGYLLKDCSFEELLKAIHAVAAGKTYFSSDIAGHVITQCMRQIRHKDSMPRELTSREREVLQLLAEGKSTQMIASVLNLHERTVDVHRYKIRQKLNLHNIADLTKYAVREGLTSL
jgi:DNA-binding NarL/FixJ family response regulator